MDGVSAWPDMWYVRFDTVWNDFHKQYSNNNITFQVVIPQIPVSMGRTNGDYSTNSTDSVAGIGMTTNNLTLLPGVEREIGLIDYQMWSEGEHSVVNDAASNNFYMRGMAIEMTHQWCCYGPPVVEAITGYWKTNIDLFHGDTTKGEMMGNMNWVDKNGTWSCQNVNIPPITPTFSDLSLYMMGLLDRTELAPLTLYTQLSHIEIANLPL
ncbi:MAG: hypothetical protein HQK94_18430 [Nitrospirae bacterium]|nr:hypothetical protein [Nitrospirota bacterium]